MNTHLGMCREFSGADYLSLTGYMWDTEVQKDAITRAIRVARPAGAKVVFDVADPFAVERYRGDLLEHIREHVKIELFLQEAVPQEIQQRMHDERYVSSVEGDI